MESVDRGPGSGGEGPYRFDNIVVDQAAHSLRRSGDEVQVEPKAFSVLLVLLEHHGELVGRDDLIDKVWGHHHVTPGVLTRVIAQLRHALGDDPHHPRYILTRHALGYSFIGDLQSSGGTVRRETLGPVRAAVSEPSGSGGEALNRVSPEEPVREVRPADQAASESSSSWDDERVEPEAVVGIQRAWLLMLAIVLIALVVSILFRNGSVTTYSSRASIAVMPFTNLSGDHDDDYFAEGLTEEIRDALADVKGLKVAAPVSPGIRDSAGDAKTLGKRLGVATILDASVRRDGERVRITTRLIDTATGFTIWSHTYDRKLSEIFTTQSEIAYQVVRSLQDVIPGEPEALAKRLTPTRNAAAFDSYLQGLEMLRDRSNPKTLDKAIARFDEALKQDSEFALAQAGICRAEVWRFEAGHSSDAFFKARVACQRAEKMDSRQPQVSLALGDLYRVRSDFPLALKYYRASAKAPIVRVKAHIGMAKVYAAQGQQKLAMEQFRQALKLNPLDAGIYTQIGYLHYFSGRFKEAIAYFRTASELKPGDPYIWSTLGGLYMETGENSAAAHAFQHAIDIKPDAATLSNLGLLKFQAGEYAADVALQRRAIELEPQDYMYWGNLGVALRADPSSSPEEIKDAFTQALIRVKRYLQLKPDDARAVAAYGTYSAILGDTKRAREMIQQSEVLGSQPGQVALLNAETMGILGDLDQARRRIAIARAKGIAESLIQSNFTFRRLGLLSSPGREHGPGRATSTAPHVDAGHKTGG